MVMYLAGVPVFTIMLLGCWSSDAFLHYICKQVKEVSSGISNRMISNKNFFTISNTTPDNPVVPNLPSNPASRPNIGFQFKGTVISFVSSHQNYVITFYFLVTRAFLKVIINQQLETRYYDKEVARALLLSSGSSHLLFFDGSRRFCLVARATLLLLKSHYCYNNVLIWWLEPHYYYYYYVLVWWLEPHYYNDYILVWWLEPHYYYDYIFVWWLEPN